VARADSYIADILSGKRLACKWVKLACERHVSDLKMSKDREFPYRFDAKLANARIAFIESFPHTKGKWAGAKEARRDENWQCFITAVLFGWVHKETGLRRFNEALIVIPRKNGKSDWAARIGLSGLADPNEFGAEIYAGATTEKQAWEVFRPARLMALSSPQFTSLFGVEVNASNISIPAKNARFEPLIGKPGDGSSPSMAIHDEYHEHDDDEQIDTMKTGMGARDQPMQILVTTAGSNLAGPCYSSIVQGRKVLEQVENNERLFFIEYTIDEGDNWTEEVALVKANPNYNVSVSADFLVGQQQQAIRDARKQSTFQTKHLNVWVGAKTAFFNVQEWRQCANTGLRLEDFKGKPCKIGLDLSMYIDMTAAVLLFQTDAGYATFGRYYLPEETIANSPNDLYRAWHKQGLLIATEGEVIDEIQIYEDILALSKDYPIEVAYDPSRAHMIVNSLMREGIPCAEVRPLVMNFSGPMRKLEGLIASKRIEHNGDPIMTWMISNVIAKEDNKGNIYPNKDKKQPQQKIDGVVSLLMALARYVNAQAEEPNPYQTRGVIFV
jgi:phage terminase large subunit-like protein